MSDSERQKQINQSAWENDDNWSGGFLSLYFSKTDTRVWVPKRRPAMGLTLNLGRSAGARWFVFLLLLPTIAMTVLLAFGAGAGR